MSVPCHLHMVLYLLDAVNSFNLAAINFGSFVLKYCHWFWFWHLFISYFASNVDVVPAADDTFITDKQTDAIALVWGALCSFANVTIPTVSIYSLPDSVLCVTSLHLMSASTVTLMNSSVITPQSLILQRCDRFYQSINLCDNCTSQGTVHSNQVQQ